MLCNIYIYIHNIYRYAFLDKYEDGTKLCEDSIWYKRPVCLEVVSKRVEACRSMSSVSRRISLLVMSRATFRNNAPS